MAEYIDNIDNIDTNGNDNSNDNDDIIDGSGGHVEGNHDDNNDDINNNMNDNVEGNANEGKTWVVYYTEDDYPYYFNLKTKESQWEQPEDYYASTSTSSDDDNNEHNNEDDGHDGSEGGDQGNEDDEEEVFYDVDGPTSSNASHLENNELMNALKLNNIYSARKIEFTVDNVVATVAEVKLNYLLQSLQTIGTDSDWQDALSYLKFLVIDYLLSFMEVSSIDGRLQSLAARCLAYIGQIWPYLWVTYTFSLASSTSALATVIESDFVLLSKLFCCANAAVHHVVRGSAFIQSQGPRTIVEPYLGFDVRDVKEYNLSEENSGVSGAAADQESARQSSVELAQEVRMVWLLLLFQIFASEIPLLTSLVRTQRTEQLLNAGTPASSSTVTESLEDMSGAIVQGVSNTTTMAGRLKSAAATVIVAIIGGLLHPALHLDEEAYLQSLKAVAALNYQLPPIDILSSTELANQVADVTATSEELHQYLSEGLLHLVNDVGYPEQNCPETLPVLKFCSDLVDARGSEGFFYTNDIRILVDVSLRELTNIPHASVDSESVQKMYLRLISAITTRSSWPTECYRQEELNDLLATLRATGGEGIRNKVVETIGDVNSA